MEPDRNELREGQPVPVPLPSRLRGEVVLRFLGPVPFPFQLLPLGPSQRDGGAPLPPPLRVRGVRLPLRFRPRPGVRNGRAQPVRFVEGRRRRRVCRLFARRRASSARDRQFSPPLRLERALRFPPFRLLLLRRSGQIGRKRPQRDGRAGRGGKGGRRRQREERGPCVLPPLLFVRFRRRRVGRAEDGRPLPPHRSHSDSVLRSGSAFAEGMRTALSNLDSSEGGYAPLLQARKSLALSPPPAPPPRSPVPSGRRTRAPRRKRRGGKAARGRAGAWPLAPAPAPAVSAAPRRSETPPSKSRQTPPAPRSRRKPDRGGQGRAPSPSRCG